MSREQIDIIETDIKTGMRVMEEVNPRVYCGLTYRPAAEHLYEKGYRKQEWISVDERSPTKDENDRGIVGIVTGFNGKIRFKDAIILVDYDFDEKEWLSPDYDLTDCKVTHWMPLPEAPKGGAE